jgi:hypothetical protein
LGDLLLGLRGRRHRDRWTRNSNTVKEL